MTSLHNNPAQFLAAFLVVVGPFVWVSTGVWS